MMESKFIRVIDNKQNRICGIINFAFLFCKMGEFENGDSHSELTHWKSLVQNENSVTM